MATRVNLQTITAQFPKCLLSLRIEKFDSSFRLASDAPPRYVWPDVEDDGAASQIVLVTAPGAMGKTMAANALSHDRFAPLIDLAKLPVGSATLTGTLTRVLGWAQAPEFVRHLQEGRASLVLDGVDEAQVAAGRDHFLAFLEDVVEVLEQAEKSAQLTMFGRRDAMELTAACLTELGVVPRELTLLPLSKRQAEELIGLTLDDTLVDGRPYTTHRAHPEPFGALREAVFVDIATALGAEQREGRYWRDVSDFLGYPPVLLVLA